MCKYKCIADASTSLNLRFLYCRWTYIEFYSRYSILMSQAELKLGEKKQTCRTVLQRLIPVRSPSFTSLLFFHYAPCRLYIQKHSVLNI